MNTVEDYHDYVDRDGKLLFQMVRYRNDKKELEWHPRKPNGWDKKNQPIGWDYEFTTDDVVHGPVLYRLPEVLKAPKDRRIVVTDGEQDADSLAALKFVATTNAHGSGWWTPGHAERLKGRQVIVIDRDPQKTSWLVGSIITAGATKVWIVAMPDNMKVTNFLLSKMEFKPQKYERLDAIVKRLEPDRIEVAKKAFVSLLDGVEPWSQST